MAMQHRACLELNSCEQFFSGETSMFRYRAHKSRVCDRKATFEESVCCKGLREEC
jgi:hypothetical protein